MRRAVLSCAVLVLLTADVSEVATTSRLTGRVLDAANAPVAGVSVSLWSEVLIGGTQAATSDERGRFAFNLLPPGPYTVRAELPGFVPAETAARVALDRETQVQLVLVATDFTGEIEVNALAPVIDTTRVSGGASYGEDYLRKAAVGVQGRDWPAVLLQTPGASIVAGEPIPEGVMPGKNPRVMGSTQSENVYLLDWINVTDPLHSTFGTWLNYDAIHEVSIEKTGLDAEYGLALGGVINLVTKSGGNSFSGSVDLRYRDHHLNEAGENFDPDRDPSSLRALSATVGGPIQRDRLWFFAATGQYLEETTPTGSPVASRVDRRDWIVKTTWSANDSTRVIVKASGFPVDLENYNAGINITAEAGARQRNDTHIFQAELHSVLTDSLLLTVQAGVNRGFLDRLPTSGDLHTPARYNRDRDLWFDNFKDYWFSDRDRDQAQASLTWFVDELAGRHELKAGVAYQELRSTEDPFHHPAGMYMEVLDYRDPDTAPDGTGMHDEDGDGYTDRSLFVAAERPGVDRATAELWSAYAQDGWRPLTHLTVRAGVRLDTAKHVNRRDQVVANLERWQPRLGLAWDPLGNGRQVLRASWGRTMHPAAAQFIYLSAVQGGDDSEYSGYEYYCGLGLCDRDYLSTLHEQFVTVDENGDEHFWYLMGPGDAFVDLNTPDTLGEGRLEAPWAETWSLGVERELWPETSLELEYVHKRTRDLIEDTCKTNTWLWDDSVPEPVLDDPATWTDLSDGCQPYVYANVPQAQRDYEAAIATLESRHERSYLKASYTWSRSRGSSVSEAWDSYAQLSFDYFPAGFVNTYGSMPDDRRHVLKLSGYALLPWGLTVSLACAWGSAPPIDARSYCRYDNWQISEAQLIEAGYDPVLYDYCNPPTSPDPLPGAPPWLFLEPRGNDRGRASYNLDLGLAKAFHIGPTTLELNLAILNVTDSERPTQYYEREFDPDMEHGTVTGWTQPRRYQVGVRIDF